MLYIVDGVSRDEHRSAVKHENAPIGKRLAREIPFEQIVQGSQCAILRHILHSYCNLLKYRDLPPPVNGRICGIELSRNSRPDCCACCLRMSVNIISVDFNGLAVTSNLEFFFEKKYFSPDL